MDRKVTLYKRNEDGKLTESGLFLTTRDGQNVVVNDNGNLAFLNETLYIKAPLPAGFQLYGSEGL